MLTSIQKQNNKTSYRFHPIVVVTYLLLLGITSIFFALSIAYLYTTYNTHFSSFKLPLLFHANSVIILVSSYSMHQTRLANLRDDERAYSIGLLVTMLLGIAFAAFQIVAWNELFNSGISMQSNVAGAYLYVISGLHFLHIIAGIIVLSIFWLKAKERQDNPVKELLFDTDPVAKLKVKCLALYWHFVDGLWLYLYAFFLLNYFLASSNN